MSIIFDVRKSIKELLDNKCLNREEVLEVLLMQTAETIADYTATPFIAFKVASYCNSQMSDYLVDALNKKYSINNAKSLK